MTDVLAIDGGVPVRERMLPYSHQSIEVQDIDAVIAALSSDLLTTGPTVREFEKAFARFTGANEAVAVSSGTAALHAAVHALDVGPGDEVIVPALTFAASANCVVYQGATPVFADVDADTLLIDPIDVEAKVTPRTKAIIAVDYAGQPCDYHELRGLADKYHLGLIADACHSLGASYRGINAGQLGDLNVFSLHPVKAMTTCEGGVVTTAAFETSHRLRCFRNHGITTDHTSRERSGSWYYEMVDLGYNYRLSDVQCALGMSQIGRLTSWIARRRAIAERYSAAFEGLTGIKLPTVRSDREHAYHLYVLRVDHGVLTVDRAHIFAALRAEGIGVNVHYIPVHLHPFYREKFYTKPGSCPRAERAYEEIISLPLFPTMKDDDINDVIGALWKVITPFKSGARLNSSRSYG